jgi:hypothetical protein
VRSLDHLAHHHSIEMADSELQALTAARRNRLRPFIARPLSLQRLSLRYRPEGGLNRRLEARH